MARSRFVAYNRPSCCEAEVFAGSFGRYADYPIYATPYDTLCNPGSSAYAPHACEAFYEYFR